MALPMTRPWKHPKTGVYWLRKRVPADLRALVERSEELQTLGTKDPNEAKVRLAKALIAVDRRWANLRRGPIELSEREADELVRPLEEIWLTAFSENPSEQLLWHAEWYDRLWTESSLDAVTKTIAVDALVINSMRTLSFRYADDTIEEYGVIVDEYGRYKIARAVGAALQRCCCPSKTGHVLRG